MKETVSSPISSDTSMSGLGILLPIHDSVLFVEGREIELYLNHAFVHCFRIHYEVGVVDYRRASEWAELFIHFDRFFSNR